MAKRYEIELHVDHTQADAASARSAQAAEKIEAAHKRAADVQERAAKRAADAQERAAQRATEASVREAKRRAKEVVAEAERQVKAQVKLSDQAAAVAERSAKRAADATEREEKRAADAAAREAKRAADAKVRENQRAQDRLTAMGGRLLSDDEVRAKGHAAVYDRLNDKKIAASAKLAEKERVAALSVRDRMKEGFESFTSSINPASIAMTAAVAGIGFAVRDVANEWRRVATGIEDSIRFTTKYREMMPENASVKGHVGDDTREVRENLELRKETLQTAQESTDFENAMMNKGNATVASKKISQEEFNKLKVVGGQLQVAQGANAETQGELFGRLPALMQPKLDAQGKAIPFTADEVVAKGGKLKDILDAGGAKYNVGSDQLLKNSNLYEGGSYRSIEEQAALQSAFSLSNERQAGEMTSWLVRATTGNLVDKKIGGGYFKRLGVKEGMKPLDIGGLVSDDLAKQEAAAKAAGKEFSMQEYLPKQGFQNQEDVKSLVALHAIRKSGELKNMMDRAAAPDSAKPIQDAIAAFQVSPRAQVRSRQYTDDAAQFSFKRDHETADDYRQQTFNMLKSLDILHGDYKDNQNYFSFSRGPQRIHDESRRLLEDAAKKAGVDISDLKIGRYSPFSSQIDLDRPFQSAIDRIRKAGVNPFKESRILQGRITDAKLREQTQAEADPRAGLVVRGALERNAFRSIVPPRPRFSGSGPSLFAPIPGDANQALAGMMAQLLNLTQQSIYIQQDQVAKLAEANRQRGQTKPQPISPPLWVQGPGKISPR